MANSESSGHQRGTLRISIVMIVTIVTIVLACVALALTAVGLGYRLGAGSSSSSVEFLEKKLTDAEAEIVVLQRAEATSSPAPEIPGPPRMQIILGTLLFGNWIRWELIEPYGRTASWTEANKDDRFRELKNAIDGMKSESRKKGFVDNPERLIDPYESEEDRMAEEQNYEEYLAMDAALTKAIKERDIAETVKQLGNWRTNNTVFMNLASRRLHELVQQHFGKMSKSAQDQKSEGSLASPGN